MQLVLDKTTRFTGNCGRNPSLDEHQMTRAAKKKIKKAVFSDGHYLDGVYSVEESFPLFSCLIDPINAFRSYYLCRLPLQQRPWRLIAGPHHIFMEEGKPWPISASTWIVQNRSNPGGTRGRKNRAIVRAWEDRGEAGLEGRQD